MIIELVCYLYDKKLADLDVKADDIEAKFSVDTKQIESVRECISEDAEEICKETCYIYLKSGASWQVKKPYKEMVNNWKCKQ